MIELEQIPEIHNPFNNAPVYYIDKISSTMDLAREHISGDESNYKKISGRVIVAGFQTHGRGRIPGRVWKAEAGENLTFTLILHKNDIVSGQIPIPLTVGLGLSLYLEEYFNLKPEIKWPNDILIKGRKISGIYIQYMKDYYLIGIGINGNQLAFPSDITASATSIQIETGINTDIYKVLSDVLLCIDKALHVADKQYEIEKRLYMKGREVTFLSGDPALNNRISGVLTGIGEGGVLLLTSAQNIINISAGEMLL